MAAAKKRRRTDTRLDAYRRIRKPMPPPERLVEGDRRRDAERLARREAEQDLDDLDLRDRRSSSEGRDGDG